MSAKRSLSSESNNSLTKKKSRSETLRERARVDRERFLTAYESDVAALSGSLNGMNLDRSPIPTDEVATTAKNRRICVKDNRPKKKQKGGEKSKKRKPKQHKRFNLI